MKKFYQFDLHIHTPFSDGQIDFDTLIHALIENDVKIAGFSDHIFPFAIYTHPKRGKINPKGLVNNYSAKQLRYRKKIIKFYDRKYTEIKLLHGGEIDIYPHGTLSLPSSIGPAFFDYLMVAKHHTVPKPISILYKHIPKVEKWMWTHNPRLKLNQYLWEKGLYAAFQRYQPDIFAHPQEGFPKYLSDARIKRFILYCKQFEVALELNHFPLENSGLKRLLHYGKKYGIKFSLGSDFHGFKPHIKSLLNHIYEMYEIVESYELNLIDPRNFLKV